MGRVLGLLRAPVQVQPLVQVRQLAQPQGEEWLREVQVEGHRRQQQQLRWALLHLLFLFVVAPPPKIFINTTTPLQRHN